MKSKQLTVSALLLAAGVLVPQVFHLTGIPKSGEVFLPMHIPVLLAGFILGPFYGAVIGALSPVISFIATGMPTAERLPFMVIELLVYGLISGLLYRYFTLQSKKFGTYTALFVTMLAGRIAYALSLLVAANLMHVSQIGPVAAFTATVTGLPGIALQAILIPGLVYSLKRGGLLDGLYEHGKRAVSSR